MQTESGRAGMKCVVYKSLRRANTYLYVEEHDNFARVPKPLLAMLGRLQFVMALELTPQRKLALADANEVRRLLGEQGYFLRLPPREFPPQPS